MREWISTDRYLEPTSWLSWKKEDQSASRRDPQSRLGSLPSTRIWKNAPRSWTCSTRLPAQFVASASELSRVKQRLGRPAVADAAGHLRAMCTRPCACCGDESQSRPGRFWSTWKDEQDKLNRRALQFASLQRDAQSAQCRKSNRSIRSDSPTRDGL